jgi:signal transduction histidine kinase
MAYGLFLTAVALSLWIAYSSIRPVATGTSMTFDHALFLHRGDAIPPVDWSKAELRRLPDRWGINGPSYPTIGWYRVTWRQAESSVSQARYLLIDNQYGKHQVYVNRIAITPDFNRDETALNRFIVPVKVLIPSALLTSGKNTIDIRIWSDGRYWTIGRIMMGSETKVDRLYWSRRVLSIEGSIFCSAMTFALSVFIAWLGLKQSDIHVYGWFSAAGIAWVYRNLLHILPNVPMQISLWRFDLLLSCSDLLVASLLLMFILSWIDRSSPRKQTILLGICLISFALPFISPISLVENFTIRNIVIALTFSMGCFMCYCIIRRALTLPKLQRIACSLALSLCLIFAINDIIYQTPLVEYGVGFLLLPYTSLLFSLLVTWLLVTQYRDLMRTTQASNEQLEFLVAARTLALEQSHREIESLSQQELITRERGRVMRELHDGVGAQLAIVNKLLEHSSQEQHELRHLIQEALDALRLTVDSSGGNDRDLLSTLGDFRYTLSPRLGTLGIELVWRMLVEEDELFAGPECALDCLRITQEMVANTLKHAQATKVVFEFAFRHNIFSIRCLNDGVRPVSKSGRVGNGLRNIETRASRHHGSVRAARVGENHFEVIATLRLGE